MEVIGDTVVAEVHWQLFGHVVMTSHNCGENLLG